MLVSIIQRSKDSAIKYYTNSNKINPTKSKWMRKVHKNRAI